MPSVGRTEWEGGAVALGGEIYRCEVLGIPNCD
jgi:hypothetical protein